jgi:chaperone BCS1
MFSLIQQLSKELARSAFSSANLSAVVDNAAAAAGNATTPLNPQTIQNLKNFNFQASDFIYIWRFIASFSVARDWIKLFLLGSVLETIRRFAGTIWTRIVDSFFLTATFESDDDAYNWMMIWISRQPAWKTARDVQISTRVSIPSPRVLLCFIREKI